MQRFDVMERGATRNSGLPPRERDPWSANPDIQRLIQRQKSEMPEAHAREVAKYIQLSALTEWGAINYEPGSLEEAARALQDLPIQASLGVNLQMLAVLLQSCEDLLIRMIKGPEGKAILLLGVDGLMDTDRVERHVVSPLVQGASRITDPNILPTGFPGDQLYTWLQFYGLSAVSMHTIQRIGQAVSSALQGDLVVMVDGFAQAVFVSQRGWAERTVQESSTEPSVRGPKDAFNESIRTMTSLIRRRIRSPHLRIERFLIGTQSPTAVDLLYIQGLTSPDLIHEARARLGRIQIDRLRTVGMLEELLEDQPSAFFPQFLTTERPDRVSAALMEGQFALLVDGEPDAKVAPVSFTYFLPSSDDYEERWWWASFIVWIRIIFLVMVLTLPSIYVSVMSVHPDLIPTRILISVAAARLGIPYPSIVEVMLLELFFEGLREATAVLPQTLGSALTVVGGLVLGEGAIASGLASPATVVIVALTGIASFTIPSYSLTIGLRILRFGLVVLSSIYGLYGLLTGLLLLTLHMASLRSFGRPYLQPWAPFTAWENLDSLGRAPFWLLTKRPKGNRPLNPRRSAAWLRPTPKQ